LRNKDCWDKLFSHKAPDVSAEIANWGKWEGQEAVKRLYYQELGGNNVGPEAKGMMFCHALDTPSIQIAGDGKTAKGVWFSPGHETSIVGGKPQALWCWSYYGADFIKEDGNWKLWHYHCYAMFRTPFERSWVEEALHPTLTVGNDRGTAQPAGFGPNKPYTYFNEYTTTSVRELVPAPPEPYETFDPSKAY